MKELCGCERYWITGNDISCKTCQRESKKSNDLDREVEKHWGKNFVKEIEAFNELHKDADIHHLDKCGDLMGVTYRSPLAKRIEMYREIEKIQRKMKK